jgi:deoxyribodipyrimidine photo-lyase
MGRPGSVPKIRVLAANRQPVRGDGDVVCYWMTAARRTRYNFALQRAVWWASDLGKPLVVVEDLRCGNPWDCDRFHRFVLDGMRDNARHFQGSGVLYYPYVEPGPAAAEELVASLSSHACVMVTDDFPCFALPALVSAAGRQSQVLLEKVDSNGLLPLRAADRVYPTAHSFRRFLQRALPEHLMDLPLEDPLSGVSLPSLERLPEDITSSWPQASAELLDAGARALHSMPLDHRVTPVSQKGGSEAAEAVLEGFLTEKLAAYPEARNHPDDDATSGLSAYLHHGHLSVHQVFAEVVGREGWSVEQLSDSRLGSRSGWWGLEAAAEAFLDELVTWREVGYNMASRREDLDRYESLPEWALTTLARHAGDPRPYLYDLEDLGAARTHDALWNAAQRQLVREGRMHNYLRMLWGKKILEWSPSPREAVASMVELNNRYALDGRDPNSYSGILWCLGRYDRAWGPERPIFGKVRYMSSENTARKTRVRRYLQFYGSEE